MTHVSKHGRSGIFKLSLEDSGEGFEYPKESHQRPLKINSQVRSADALSGRGIPLISSLCDSLKYLGCGNKVIAEIHWPKKSTAK
jgi:anti-sigma regulatory factor (Ser/Thr protein kinase)